MKIFDTPWIRGYRLSYSQHVHTVFGRQLGDSYCFGIQYAKQYAAARHMLNSVCSDTPYAILAERVCRYAAYVGMQQ
jgi:hypothetical protein